MKSKLLMLVLIFSFGILNAQEKIEFKDLKKPPEPVKFMKPAYPELAQKSGITGEVFVQALIDIEGIVKEAKILKSSNDMFNESALNAIRGTKFSPGIGKDNKAVEAWVTIPLRYKLGDNVDAKKETGKTVKKSAKKK